MARSFSSYFIKYHRKRLEKIQAFIEELRGSLSEETIHKLRLQLKKIRAFYRLIENIDASFPAKKYFRSLRRLSKISNITRDLQVQIGLPEIKKSKSPGLLHYLKEREEKKIHKLENILSHWDNGSLHRLQNKFKKKVQDMGDDRILDGIRYILKHNKKKINLFSKEGSDANGAHFHSLRKLINRQKNYLKIYAEMTGIAPSKDIKTLSILHDVIGQWHDNEVTIAFLDNYMAKTKTPSATLATLHKKLLSSREIYLGKIKSTLISSKT